MTVCKHVSTYARGFWPPREIWVYSRRPRSALCRRWSVLCIPYLLSNPLLTSPKILFGARKLFCSFGLVAQIFDPLGLSDGAAPGDIKKWREAEIKHGRVAMLASLGVLVAEVGRAPTATRRVF